ncbi:MAG: hypothetical protein IH600_12945 [Bacteroidetes bacterium]|nr:hypothetical protein [Bacteroidota bacterium]
MEFLPQDIYSDVNSEMKATTAGAFVCNETDRGLVRMDGKDARDLLHRLSTARIDNLQEGQLRETLLTNEKGRVIDALIAVRGTGALRLLTSAGRADAVIAWLEKFTIMEDCTYTNLSSGFAQFSIYNLPADGADPLPELILPGPGAFISTTLSGMDVDVLHHRSVCGAGVRIICRMEDAEKLWRHLVEDRELPAVGREAFALWRVAHLLPACGQELSEQANPLEAGAEMAVDFRKGCFIGQEVIARLDSYDKVQRHPRRLLFAEGVEQGIEPGTVLLHDGSDAGFVTTTVWDPSRERIVGMGLIRLAYETSGTLLTCGDAAVEVLAS